MTEHDFDIRRIGGRIGAEILGVDIARPLDPGVVAEINAALIEHKALFFRGQRLDDVAQYRFASLFGELTAKLTANRPVAPATAGAGSPAADQPPAHGDGGPVNHWYTEASHLPAPPRVTTLRSLVVPPYGGDTLIANTATAYQESPAPLRALADRLWAVHAERPELALGHPPGPEHRPGPGRPADHRPGAGRPPARTVAHPVVRVHPESGERALFIGAFAQRLVGFDADDSTDLLRVLQGRVTRPENVVRWRWAPGDLAIFDNRSTQHYAPDDHGTLPRLLHRVTVAGDVPVGTDGERSRVVEGDRAEHHTPASAA
ncbi:TauD/TfdA family dioxygenase [Streptomyces sp. DSM 44915]|uniref:TauD/TfdA family dioxygenase n=1 Tax=Streptomyces chisholmiae TaxID=3075540 RepID=A0ABU2JMU2_9ACTN|nr:TauD/TfdA family dioxygenase [Streptomyces sp. DSM 44915]MDT0266313.1 TauD/TfdA family dioxygenase [Streptomyces sp. DSM 44915]